MTTSLSNTLQHSHTQQLGTHRRHGYNHSLNDTHIHLHTNDSSQLRTTLLYSKRRTTLIRHQPRTYHTQFTLTTTSTTTTRTTTTSSTTLISTTHHLILPRSYVQTQNHNTHSHTRDTAQWLHQTTLLLSQNTSTTTTTKLTNIRHICV